MESCTTRAVILRQIKYSDSSVILKTYTEQSGIQSFILRGVRKKNKKTGMGVLMPMALVDLTWANSKSDLQYIKEISPAVQFHSIPFEPVKNSILIFLNEILNQILKEETANRAMFSFIFHSLEFFDKYQGPVANYHLLFLSQLTHYLGIEPRNNYDSRHCVFDPEQGLFKDKSQVAQALRQEEAARGLWIHKILKLGYTDLVDLDIPYQHRQSLNDILIRYYTFHIPGFGKLKSLEIIQMVLSE